MNVIAFTSLLAQKYDSVTRFKILRSSVHMTRIILAGSYAIDVLIIFLLIFSWLFLDHAFLIGRIMIGIIVLLYLTVVSFLVHKKLLRVSAWMLVVLYGIVGMITLHSWGINEPIGILILAFVIFLASVMLGPKHILLVTIGIIFTLCLLQYFNIIGVSHPDLSLLDDESSYIDVASYSVIFAVFAVVAWVSSTKMETTLVRAVKAEQTLQDERDELTIRVEEQTKRIVAAQHKELKQLYKFAELGQLTTIILHELANYLSVLTLDIDDLDERHENSIAVDHAKESIFYIDTIIDQVRNQIKNSDDTRKFDALATTKDSLEQLRKKLVGSNIKLFVEDTGVASYSIIGDPLRLSQAITILVSNAAQANQHKQAEICIEISATKANILISVKDFGTGITNEVRSTLFQPQKSKKGSGLGIGLYVTKQIIDTHFKGAIWLSSATEYTQFNIEIPRAKH